MLRAGVHDSSARIARHDVPDAAALPIENTASANVYVATYAVRDGAPLESRLPLLPFLVAL